MPLFWICPLIFPRKYGHQTCNIFCSLVVHMCYGLLLYGFHQWPPSNLLEPLGGHMALLLRKLLGPSQPIMTEGPPLQDCPLIQTCRIAPLEMSWCPRPNILAWELSCLFLSHSPKLWLVSTLSYRYFFPPLLCDFIPLVFFILILIF